MLELALKLVDRCVDLISQRSQPDEMLYQNYVAPAADDLEALHRSCVERFTRYRDMMRRSTDVTPSHPVFDAISRDSVYTDEMRAHIAVLRPFLEDSQLGPFIRAVHDYIIKPEQLTFHLRAQTAGPNPRGDLSNYGMRPQRQLGDVAWSSARPHEKVRRGTELLDEVVREIQERYSVALEAQLELKRRLLRE